MTEPRHRALITLVIILSIALLFPLAHSLQGIGQVALGTRVQAFGHLLGENAVFGFGAPLLPALVVSPWLSQQLAQRFISLTRLREPIRVRLLRMLGWNALAGGLVMFLIPFLTFTVAFYVAPRIGWLHLDPATYNLHTPAEIHSSETSQFAFSQLMAIGPLAYGLSYSAWVGLLGAAYATLTLALMVMLPNRFVGLSLPWVGYLIGSFVLAALNLPGLAPTAITPFNLTQVPMWQPLTMSALVAGSAIMAALLLLSRVQHWESLQ